MRILLGYSYYHYLNDIRCWVEMYCLRLRAAGFAVDPFYLTLNPPGPALEWAQLETKWRQRDATLMRMYDALAARLHDYDVFLNWNGINVHPEFLPQLPGVKAFACFDDPENSHNLSQPCAAAYDLALVGNIAEVETYRRWGVSNALWWPLGFHDDDCDPTLTRDDILQHARPIDVLFVGDRTAPWRQSRLDAYAQGVPKGCYRGRGWPAGPLPETHRVLCYQRARIGPNFHHSTGPINFRTFAVPANGALLLCDNREHLGRIFRLGEECVGFDTVTEAVELTHHFLQHEDERRRIAANGFERCRRDYNEVAIFRRFVDAVRPLVAAQRGAGVGQEA